jgi:hypothetical protein
MKTPYNLNSKTYLYLGFYDQDGSSISVKRNFEMEGRKEERERGDFKDRKLNFREIK